ncbi:hypothetical protein H6P81_003384 [Aristolochia fimbriata]|uniref:Uncharacterized protein n=1 Tax=Aristolochia fimbriata TaxID=158543 RepID=A0AAV7FFN9_ARIFI|nr:hypothetical protein H6P81_003384 [Aristolochia fimbriata]
MCLPQTCNVTHRELSTKPRGGDFVAACVSSKGDWIYCIGEDRFCKIYGEAATNITGLGDQRSAEWANNYFDNQATQLNLPNLGLFWILPFDGASKGNPGISGIGEVFRALDGSRLLEFAEPLTYVDSLEAEVQELL